MTNYVCMYVCWYIFVYHVNKFIVFFFFVAFVYNFNVKQCKSKIPVPRFFHFVTELMANQGQIRA